MMHNNNDVILMIEDDAVRNATGKQKKTFFILTM